MLLGRYRRNNPGRITQYPRLDVKFMTIHSSKGLQADYVMILNVEGGKHGFPSQIEGEEIMSLVMPDPEEYPDAEERRLMYVALTRAKRAVFVLASEQNSSPFAEELEVDPDVLSIRTSPGPTEPCPACAQGHLVPRKGRYSVFRGCSNYPICRHTEAM